MGENILNDTLSTLKPTLEMLTSLSLTAQRYWATFSSLTFPKLSRCVSFPRSHWISRAFSFTSRKTEKEWHLPLFWLWHLNSPQWGQNHHLPGDHQKMLEKTKCYSRWWGGPSLQIPPQPHLIWGETITHCVFSFCDQHHLLNHQSHYLHPPPLHLHRHHHW